MLTQREDLARLAHAQGFNLMGSVSVKSADAQAPAEHRWERRWSSTRSIVLLGSGGRFFWESLTEADRQGEDVIDETTVRRVEALVKAAGWNSHEMRAIYPFREEGRAVSFLRLAERCGWGTTQTVLGYLLHPVYGPWVSLRAALLLSFPLDEEDRTSTFSPCGACAKPCIAACPAMAILPTGYHVPSCQRQLVKEKSCDNVCLSRAACVIGSEHQYGDEESAHRQGFFKRSLLEAGSV